MISRPEGYNEMINAKYYVYAQCRGLGVLESFSHSRVESVSCVLVFRTDRKK